MNVRLCSLIMPFFLMGIAFLGFALTGPLGAAEPEFVGVLALAVDKEVVKELELVPQQKAKLLQLIDAREAEALELVMQLRADPAEDQAQKLEAFRRASEAQGLLILTSQQRAMLEQIRLRRLGMASLAEPAVVEKLQLSQQQRRQIADLLKQREDDLARADEKTAYRFRLEAERQIAAVLSPQQKSDWDALVSGARPSVTVPSPAAVSSADLVAGPGQNAAPPEEITPQQTSAASHSAIQGAAQLLEGPPTKRPEKIRFNFHFQPWNQVLDWFVQQAGYSLICDAPPPGTFNYSSDRLYTPAEAIDLMNSVLLTKDYTLVRRADLLMLINLKDGIPPNLVEVIAPEQLDQRGEYELVSVLFNLKKLTAEDAALEINKLIIGPQGSVVPLPKSRQVQVTETAGRLRAIRAMIQRIENPPGATSRQKKVIQLQRATPEDVLPVVRQMLDIPEDQNFTDDGSLRIVPDPRGKRLLVSGTTAKIEQLEEILRFLDVLSSASVDGDPLAGTPQLVVHPVTAVDPKFALKVMQTLLYGQPNVHLEIDSKTGNLVALARLAQHATIRATLDQMQRDARQVEVFQLRSLDPQLAVLAINNLFGAGSGTTKGTALQVDAEPNSRRLILRGTEAQIQEVRDFLEKMGETGEDDSLAAGSTVRTLPLSPRTLDTLMDRVKEIWPTMRPNKIRVVTPSDESPPERLDSPALRPGVPQRRLQQNQEEEPRRRGPPDDRFRRRRDDFRPPWAFPTSSPPRAEEEKSAGRSARSFIRFVSEQKPVENDVDPLESTAKPVENTAKPEGSPNASTEAPTVPPPIIVSPTRGGVIIASEDVEALNEFEQLLTSLAGGALSGGPELTVFYLTHAKADVVAETLDQIFGGGTLTQPRSRSGGDRGLIGNLAGGGIVGALLGLDGGGMAVQPSGAVVITPDERLNALIVQANPLELDTIEQLLEILDRKGSPEDILVASKARMIPVYNTNAETIAEILKQVYQDRLVTGAAAAARPPTPQEFLQMLRGGRGRGSRGGATQGATEEKQKMSIGVDARTNSLVIAAPESLFQKVKELVEQLDVASDDSNETMRMVILHHTSPEAVGQALSAIAGEGVQIGRTTTSAGRTPAAQARSSSGRRGGRDQSSRMSDFQRRMEFFRNLQRGSGGDRGQRGGRSGR